MISDKPVAVVTGGSRGIGRAIARALAHAGFDIALNYVHAGDEVIQQALADIAAPGVCLPFRADISRPAERAALIEFLRSRFGRCDLLVNNAGVAPLQRADILEANEESFDRVLDINLKGPYFFTQAVANWMVEQRRAFPDRPFRIVNVGSISAYTSSTARGEYCISKAGVGMMTMLFADRLADFNIGVFEVRPGIIATDMTSAVKAKYDALIAQGLTPIRRWGRPEDVANAILAVAEGRLDFCTGQVINADGGFHLRRL